MEKDQISAEIGKRLKQIRTRRQLSLDALAKLTGVSKPMLGQIERGASNPTVATLWKIASGLGVPFTTFLDATSGAKLVRAEDQPAVYEDADRFQVYHVFTSPSARVEVYRLRMLPGCSRTAESHAVGVLESLTVARGQLRIRLQDAVYELADGDAIQFEADVPHAYENPYEAVCEAHLVILYPA